MAFLGDVGKALFGQKEKVQQLSPLTGEQQQLFSQLMQAMQGKGAGGAFGDVADYYRGLVGGDSETQQQMEAPLMRQFQEDIMPGIAEQFAGMGAGGLSSSGFEQQASRAATDLGERLGSIRAQLRQQGAQGLSGLAQGGLSPVQETVVRPATGGLLGGLAQGAGAGLGMAAGYGLPDAFSAMKKRFSGGGAGAGVTPGESPASKFGLPKFNPTMR